MEKLHILSISFVLLFSFAFMFSCSLDEAFFNDGLAVLEINLKSTESNYQQFNLDLEQVVVDLVGDDELHADTKVGVYNLSDLEGGNGTLLVHDTLPTFAKIEALILKLGPKNSIVLNNQRKALDIGSNTSKTVKIPIEMLIEADVMNHIQLQVDLDNSIVTKNSGELVFEPNIQVIP